MNRQELEAAKIIETPVPSQTVTASGDSGILSGYGGIRSLAAQLNVTNVQGTTPTLDVFIEHTIDGVNWWPLMTTQAFNRVNAMGLQYIITAPGYVFSDRLRVRWVVGGVNPSFTFEVDWVVQP